MLRLWPQAVSLDEADLKCLRELCDLRRKGTSVRPLRWADYLWLDLVDPPAVEAVSETKSVAHMTDTRGDGSSLTFWSDSISALRPITGSHAIAERVAAVVEVKTIETDLQSKLEKAYIRGGQWKDQAKKILASHLQEKLRSAQTQIRDTKRLLGYEDALGIVILIAEKAGRIPREVVSGYITQSMASLDFVDAVAHLPNDENGRAQSPTFMMGAASGGQSDEKKLCFQKYLQALFQATDLDSRGSPVPRIEQPYIFGQVNIDATVRDVFADDWEEALRLGYGDRIKVAFREQSQFRPGLSGG